VSFLKLLGIAGDFLHELIALAEYLATDTDELIGMGRMSANHSPRR
jgi:hypothetical protein